MPSCRAVNNCSKALALLIAVYVQNADVQVGRPRAGGRHCSCCRRCTACLSLFVALRLLSNTHPLMLPQWRHITPPSVPCQNYIIKNMTQGKALLAASASSTTPSEAAEMAAELLE